MVRRMSQWYSSAATYRETAVYRIHFLFSMNSAKTRMPVMAGMSNRLVSCMLKKKYSNSSSPAHRPS